MGNKNYSKGITWIDDCRIPFVEQINFNYRTNRTIEQTIYGGGKGIPKLNGNPEYNTQGRFPANLLVSDDMLNDGSMSKAGEYKGNGSKSGGIWSKSTGKPAGIEYGDKGSNSRYYDIDKWFNNLIDG